MDTLSPYLVHALVLDDPWNFAKPELEGKQGTLRALATDLRLVKAALLYADAAEVDMLSLAAEVASGEAWPWSSDEDLQYDLIEASFAHRTPRHPPPSRKQSEPADLSSQTAELRLASQSGALLLHPQRSGYLLVPVSPAGRWAVPPRTTEPSALWEGHLAIGLLGELEAFPDATMDVILDVRERLTASRVHFRAALATVARELCDAEATAAEIDKSLSDLRRRVIDPALDEIRVELTSLGVRRTLMRLASDRVSMATAGATLTLAAGAGGGLGAMRAAASAAASAPVAAAVAKEMSFREELRSELVTRPYWLLHEAARALRDR
jgi:hypothetical protein